jgi:hypothetical protein
MMNYTPVVILGAGRSGTNILRDMMTALPDMGTWACDEINPIWRHGNITWPDDEIPAARATPKVNGFIQRAFDRVWNETGQPKFVVEKTCANTLRVPFVDAAIPEARFIHIVRDGVDVLASAQKRWKGDLELPGLPYFLAKARYAPKMDLPLYGLSFVRSRIALLFGQKKRLAVWGPRFKGMQDLQDASLEELCARQWVACVEQTTTALAQIDSARVLHLRYEDMVAEPEQMLRKILQFLGHDVAEDAIVAAAAMVKSTSVGKGRAALLDTIDPAVVDILTPTLKAQGYSI